MYAELLPDQKVESIQKLQFDNRKVCMIGDGVNDAPALKTAEVGVAMGEMGSDIAVDAADIALMSDDISKVLYLKRLSNATVNTIKLSITLSMCINFVAIILSVTGILNPSSGECSPLPSDSTSSQFWYVCSSTERITSRRKCSGVR